MSALGDDACSNFSHPAHAPHLRPVGDINIETCSQCGGTVKIIACIENPTVIKKILDHLSSKSEQPKPRPVRAPPNTTHLLLS